MSFGRNPHVAKAQAAEEKAQFARDNASRTLALREAANFWERAAERERDPKRRKEYEIRATENRDLAEQAESEGAPRVGDADEPDKLLN